MTTRAHLVTLAAGHACADFCQGAVPSLVPFLVAEGGMTYAGTGALVLAMSLTSSLLQPAIGAFEDRRPSRWTMPVGVLVAAGGIVALGLVDGLVPRMAATALAGLGVAAFHPGAARSATAAAGDRQGGGLGVFALGGSAGFALAPLALTPSVLAFGLAGTVVAVPPALVVAALLARAGGGGRVGDRDRPAATGEAAPGRFALLIAAASLRAGAYFGLQAFVAATVIERLGTGEATGNAALAALLVAGTAGTVAGGHLADRVGVEPVLSVSLAATLPAVVLLQVAPTPALTIAAAALTGALVVAGYTATVLTGQRLMPGRETLATGMTLGFAMGAGGLAVAALGPLADSAGPGAALWVSGALAAAAALPALCLREGGGAAPGRRGRRQLEM